MNSSVVRVSLLPLWAPSGERERGGRVVVSLPIDWSSSLNCHETLVNNLFFKWSSFLNSFSLRYLWCEWEKLRHHYFLPFIPKKCISFWVDDFESLSDVDQPPRPHHWLWMLGLPSLMRSPHLRSRKSLLMSNSHLPPPSTPSLSLSPHSFLERAIYAKIQLACFSAQEPSFIGGQNYQEPAGGPVSLKNMLLQQHVSPAKQQVI